MRYAMVMAGDRTHAVAEWLRHASRPGDAGRTWLSDLPIYRYQRSHLVLGVPSAALHPHAW